MRFDPPEKHSVIRRSLLVLFAFVLGHLFHYALMIVANRILDSASFGRFYASISLLNVLLTPATVLSFMFVQYFSTVFTAGGISALVAELEILMRRHLVVGLALVLLCIFGFLLIGSLIGADALLLLAFVPLLALAIYFFEMVSAAFKGMLDFISYSIIWIAWRAGQFALASAALFVIGAAWSGLAGIFVATVVTMSLLVVLLKRRATASVTREKRWPGFRVLDAAPFLLSYGAFIIINNLDIMVAYFVLNNDQLGIYAASSFLPKAIVTATQPVSQVMLPVINLATHEGRARRPAFLKAFVVCGLLGTAGAAVLSLGGDLACNVRFGIRFCSPWLLSMISFSAIPLGMLRVLVVAGLAVGKQRYLATPALALVAFIPFALFWGRSPEGIATIYAAFCWGFMLLYGGILWAGRARVVTHLTQAH